MSKITYRIVSHDGGWAYKLEDVFSETFATREDAIAAAKSAAAEQRAPGSDEEILYEDEDGRWREEHSPGGDRPETEVKE
jgi:hypothetical protein